MIPTLQQFLRTLQAKYRERLGKVKRIGTRGN